MESCAPLTYTPTNSILYLDGQAATNGSGVTYFPPAAVRAADGFNIGSDYEGRKLAKGRFEELEAYNYPLSATEVWDNYYAVASQDSDGDGLADYVEDGLGTGIHDEDTDNDGMWDGWEVFYGLNPSVDDSGLDPDGDGLTNLQEYNAQTNPTDPTSGSPLRLGYWTFDTTQWLGERGQIPRIATNIQNVASWRTNALQVQTVATPPLMNVDFAGGTTSSKVGPAAVGLTANDFWNGHNGTSLTNLKWSNQTNSTVGLTIQNAPGSWGFSAGDAMYNNYSYAFSYGTITLTITNLPGDVYDFYLYGHGDQSSQNSKFVLSVGGSNIATNSTGTGTGWNTANWVEGLQYVAFRNVTVPTGTNVVVYVQSAGNYYVPVNGLQIVPHGAGSQLSYKDVESDNSANIAVRNGTVRFWFKPDWASTNLGGIGPGSSAGLIEVGRRITGSTNEWWSLHLDTNGTQLVFEAKAGSVQTNYLTLPVSWVSNQWHEIVLTYTPTNSILYLDGQAATNGPGETYFPSAAVRAADGFSVGSDYQGKRSALGQFEELETYNYPLAATNIAANYQLAVNDAPSFSMVTNVITLLEDTGSLTIDDLIIYLSSGPADESGQALSFEVTTTNAAFFAVAPAVNSSGILTFTVATNTHGTNVISLILHDNGGTTNGGSDTSAPQNLTIVVNSVNDAPSFTLTTNVVTVLEDAGNQTITNLAVNLTPGPADESGQALSFEVATTNAAFFAVAPAMDESGVLAFTVATNANGTNVLSVVLRDDGGTANGGADTSAPQNVTVVVTSVNDAPSISITNLTDQSVITLASSLLIAASAADVDGNITQVQFFKTGQLLGTVTNAPFNYTWSSPVAGAHELTAVATDNGGLATTSSVVHVTLNSPPTISDIEDQDINENSSTGELPFTVGDLETAATNLVLSATSSNPGLLPLTNITFGGSSSNRTVTATPVSNYFGTAIVTIFVTDEGGASPSDSFVLKVFPTNAPNGDTDYDGRSNWNEVDDGTDPYDPTSVSPQRLGYWAFDTAQWLGERGQVPLVSTNLQNVASWRTNALAVVPATPSALLNVDFGSGTNSFKTGLAATGVDTNDYWNGTVTNEALVVLTNLLWSDQSASSMGITVQNATNSGSLSSGDAMYDSYVSAAGTNTITLTITNLPAGIYDFYLYGHGNQSNQNSQFVLKVGGSNIATNSTSTAIGWNTSNWVEDLQYVVFRDTAVPAGTDVVFMVNPAASQFAMVNGLQIFPHPPSQLSYREVEADNSANITVRNGTVRFWFKPDWTGTTAGGIGLGTEAALIEVGRRIFGSTNEWWSLHLDTNGSQIVFEAQADGVHTNYLSAPVELRSNRWHEITLTYTPTNSIFYFDGQSTITGAGVSHYPSEATRLLDGFSIGSDYEGRRLAKGRFEELETFNYSLGASQISSNYLARVNLDTDGDGLNDIHEDEFGTNLADNDSDNDGMSDGWEATYSQEGLDPGDDLDGDGLTNIQEYMLQTNPLRKDTDGNGIEDGDEDCDGDGLSNLHEFRVTHSNPCKAYSLNETVNDGTKLKVAYFGPNYAVELSTFHSSGYDKGLIILGPSALRLNEVLDLPTLAAKLKNPAGNISTYIYGQLREDTRLALEDWVPPAVVPTGLRDDILLDLNTIIVGPSIWDPQRFSGVIVQPETGGFIVNNPTTQRGVARFNRLLLEDAYPSEISNSSIPNDVPPNQMWDLVWTPSLFPQTWFVVLEGSFEQIAFFLDNPIGYFVSTQGDDLDGDGLRTSFEKWEIQTSYTVADSDGDGIPDGVEWNMGTDPNDPASVPLVRLSRWRFDDVNLTTDQGQQPVHRDYVTPVSGWSGNAAQILTSSAGRFNYPLLQADATANIWMRNGTVRFWFKPAWDSGSGPSYATLLTVEGETGYWKFGVSANGSTLGLAAAGDTSDKLSLASSFINWTAGEWHQVVVTYTPTNSALYIDGQPAGGGTAYGLISSQGQRYYPGLEDAKTNGINVGSNAAGNERAGGEIDEIETFNYPLDASQILNDYQQLLSANQGSVLPSPATPLKVRITQPKENSVLP